MGELAMRAVRVTPLIEQGQNLRGLLVQQPMHRRPARRPVGQPAPRPAGEPTIGPDLADLQHAAGSPDRPPGLDRLIDQVQQAGLGGRIDTVWDPATQPQPPFPSINTSFTASSLHASDNRATSALARSSS